MKSYWRPPTSTHTHRHMDSNAIDYPKPLLHFYWVREAGKRFSFLMDISALRASTSRSSFAVLSSHGWCEPQSFTGFCSPHVDSPGEAGSCSSLLSLASLLSFSPSQIYLVPSLVGSLGSSNFSSFMVVKIEVSHLLPSNSHIWLQSSEEQRAPMVHSRLLTLQGRWVLNSQLSPVVVLKVWLLSSTTGLWIPCRQTVLT